MSPPARTLLLLLSLSFLLVPITPARAQGGGRDGRFGAVEAFWDPQAAAEAGVAWDRILFYWSQLQPNGPGDWNTLHVPDEWLQSAQAGGREVVGLLKNTPPWAAAGDVITEGSPPRGLELPISDPGNLWATFVARVVTHYAPRGVHRWIVWNEPDISPGVYGEEWGGSVEEYYRLLQVAYQVIKGIDPSAQVHLAGLTYWHDPGWLRRFLAVATADPEGAASGYYFDVVSLHIYFQTDSVDYIVNETRAALNAHGISKPIWINETNAPPDSDPLWPIFRPRWPVDLREQASFILQAHALGLAAGAQRIAVYKLIDAGLPPGGEPFGLLRPDHSRRPAFVAYQLVTQHYAGTTSARVTRDPLWVQATLDRGGRTTRVLWARTGQPVALRLPALATEALLVDQEGGIQGLAPVGGFYELALAPARCVDAQAGCFIGGPTLLLIEDAPAENLVPPIPVETATPMPVETATPMPVETATPISEPTIAVTVTQPVTVPTTQPAPPPSPTLTPTLTPTQVPTSTPTPSPTTRAPLPTPPPTEPPPSPTPTATLTPFPAVIASPSAIAVPAAQPYPTARSDTPAGSDALSFWGHWLGLLTLAVAGGLAGFALWRARTR
jgi:outer membrane biosynthesis protein TonB